MSDAGKLYLVPTPIGNMGDLTPRAVEVLKQVSLIACEDTRRSGRLLAQFDIQTRKMSFFEHNEMKRVPQIIEQLQAGGDVAVISDGGSPGLSDPAYRIVTAAIAEGIKVEALPGATAAIPALTASGMATDRFFFEGFLPVKSGKRKKRLEELCRLPHTVIIYESVHRIAKTLGDMSDICSDRSICVGREISKLHEEYLRGTAAEVLEKLTKDKQRGEFVIVIAGSANA